MMVQEISDTRDAVRKLGEQVRSARAGGYFGTLHSEMVDEAYDKGFIEGVSKLAALITETMDEEWQRREFLKDCGFDGEQLVG